MTFYETDKHKAARILFDAISDGHCSLSIGPITLGATYGIGNSSVHRFALSETTAWERAMRAGGFPS